MASSAKRCLYEVLGVDRGCSADEIRSAYKRLALQRHPDKLVQSGVPEAEATAAFQELVNAYEVLSDPRERGWYDSNRNQILFSSNSGTSGSTSQVPDLFPFFSNSVFSGYSDSGRGFYKVYGDLFEKIYANEINFAKKFGLPDPREAPVIGNSESPYVQVTAFYNYWSAFTTVLDFFWVDEIAVMPNRKSRRLLEDHNKKLRKAERKKYNDIVRQLSEFVKKRDNRVREMQIKKNEELMKKREQEKHKMKELERQKAEKARNYEEPDWSKVEEVEEDEMEDELQEKRQEFYCVICSKRFKSDKQWKNHEQSRKHKDKARELREAFDEEDNDYNTRDADEGKEGEEDAIHHVSGDDIINELKEQFEEGAGIKDDRDGEEEEWCSANESGASEASTEPGLDEDESITFEAMVYAHRNKNNSGNQPNDLGSELEVEKSEDEPELIYAHRNNNAHSRRSRRSRRRDNERHTKQVDLGQVDVTVRDKEVKEETIDNTEASKYHQISTEHAENNAPDGLAKSFRKHEAKIVKNSIKKGSTSKLPDASKERNKGGADSSEHRCEKCEEQFESRNKLHKHLAETGHASLKYRRSSKR